MLLQLIIKCQQCKIVKCLFSIGLSIFIVEDQESEIEQEEEKYLDTGHDCLQDDW